MGSEHLLGAEFIACMKIYQASLASSKPNEIE